MQRDGDFSLEALFAALDTQRQRRGLTWSEVTKEMNGGSTIRGHALSSSTVIGTRSRKVMEADGILQMLSWLNRTPESFVPGASDPPSEQLPQVASPKVLRFDTKKLYAALETERAQRKMTWKQVAAEVGVGSSTLKHLAHGGRTAFPQVMRIVAWLSQPAARFTRASEW